MARVALFILLISVMAIQLGSGTENDGPLPEGGGGDLGGPPPDGGGGDPGGPPPDGGGGEQGGPPPGGGGGDLGGPPPDGGGGDLGGPPPDGNGLDDTTKPGDGYDTTKPGGGYTEGQPEGQPTDVEPKKTSTKPAMGPMPTTKPSSWDLTKLNRDEEKKMLSAFDPNSQTQFTGGSMFDNKGNISEEFMDVLDQSEKRAVEEMQSDWKDVMDMQGMFDNKMPEDVQFFIQVFDKMDKTKFDKLNATPDALQPGDLKFIPLEVIAAMNESVRVEKLQHFQPAVKGAICDKLQNGEADYDTTQKLEKAVDCASVLDNAGRKPEGNLMEAIAANKMAEKPPRLWTPMEWQDAIRKGYIAGLPDKVIENAPPRIIMDNARHLGDITKEMDSKLKAKLFSKMKEAAGGFHHMSAGDLENMGDMMKDMSMREMKQMNGSAVRGSLGMFRDHANDMSLAQKNQIRKTLRDGMGPGDSLSGSDLVDAAAFRIGRDRALMKDVDKDTVIASVSDIGQQDMDKKSARSFAKKLRESPDYDEAADFDTTKFKDMGKIATGFSPRVVKNMTNVNFDTLLGSGDLRGIEFNKDSAKVLIERAKSDANKVALDQTDLENLGKNVKGLSKGDVDAIDADNMATALDSMKDTFNEIIDAMDKTTVDGIIQKVESATGGLGDHLESMGSLLQKVPIKKLQDLDDSSFGDLSGDTKREFNCSKDTCPEIYERVVKTIGRPGIKNPNMTLTVFKNLGKVMCGMSLDDLRMLPATFSLEGITGQLLDMKCLSDKQERILAEKLKYRLGLFSDTTREIRRQDVKTFGGVLKHFTKADLMKLGKSMCDDIALELGTQDLSNVRKEDLKDLTKFALECRNKSQGTLDEDDMSSLGDLSCGLDTDRVGDIDMDAMQDAAYNAQSKCVMMSGKERQVWAKKAMDKMNVTSSNMQDVDDVIITQLGTFVADIGDALRDKIPDDTISSVGADIVDQLEERKERGQERMDKGFGNDVSTTDKKAEDTNEMKVYTMVKDSFINTASRRRRRRSTGSTLSCDDMQLLGAGVTSLTTSQIEAMSDSDFLDCASFLGGYSTWSDAQLLSLLTVATRSGTYGSSSAWTADHVYSAGIITQGLSSSELTALTDLTDDAMYSIGRHEGWSESQLTSGFSRWLSLNKGSDASTVTSTELIALGHFVCGATTSHISSMSSTAYGYTASYIGELTTCDDSQMEAFATHAVAAFGSLDTWDTSVVSSVGTMIGGLTAEEMGTLTTTQVAAIDPASIAVIPSSTFVGFTVSQLSSFSVAQAQATTSSQQSGLSTAQKNALISAGATVQDSAASGIQASLTLMLCIAVLSTLAPRFY